MGIFAITYKLNDNASNYYQAGCLQLVIKTTHISLVFLAGVMIITITRIYLSLHQLTAINI
ncbi:hypothetical protein FDP61_00305 [Enterobacter ludwigii]|nr:hypothetical protein ABT55_10465 [Enterobacter ludwigii]AWC86980.1 hypothetical protein AM410_22165 [Enterobacter cloacae complex sp. FDA-CDC-AR_0164]KAB5481372.1 hypothetical protein F8561_09335 [Enterobacter sp. 198]TYD08176.1 hypothetical protein E4M14_003090 [Enterobacter sp. Z1]AOT42531.1 hypothetical protein BH714_04175 [Enterobacter ludwigii]